MPTYSHSKLSTFESCPQRYKFRYIDKIKVEGYDTIEAFLGSRVHEALEKLYRDVLMTKIPTVESILSFFEDNWDRNWHAGVEIVRKDYSAEDYRKLGRLCLQSFYKRYYPFDQDKTLWLEELVTFPLAKSSAAEGGSSPMYIQGRVDRLAVTPDGIFEIQDYKTSRSMPAAIEFDVDRQLALYQIAVQKRFPEAEKIRLVWHYLVFDRKVVSARTQEDLDGLRTQILDLIGEIESEAEFAPRESQLCNWCEYIDICPAHRHRFEVEKLPTEKFKEDGGVQLVDSFARLSEKKREVERALQELKGRIIKLAKEKNLAKLIGSDQQLRISFSQDYHFPPTTDPQWQALEKIIREAGRWEEIVAFSHSKLNSIMKKRSWPDELWSRVKALTGIKETPRLFLSKRSGEE